VSVTKLKSLRKVQTGYSPSEIVIDKEHNLICTACFSENMVSLNSLTTFKPVAKVKVGDGPYGIAKTEDGRAFVSNSNEGTISVIDLKKRLEIQKITVDRDQDLSR